MREPRRAPRGPDPAVPARVQMPLLTLITHQALEEDYLQAAERRVATGVPSGASGSSGGRGSPGPHGRRRSRRTAAVVVGVFGVLLSTAAVQQSRNAEVDDASRATLIDKVDTQRDRVARQQARSADLQERNDALSRSLTRLTDDEQGAEARNGRLRVRTGFVAVRGEGVRVTVSEVSGADDNQSVKVSDLVLLVNGLWEAGAEAVSINDQRLSTVSAVNYSGDAIEVNDVGVAAPFTVEAIGDSRTLASELFNTDSGLTFAGLSQQFGFDYEVDNVDQLELPAAPTRKLTLRSVQTTAGPGEESGPGQPDRTSQGGDGP